ncbi:DUF4347 domain-containing protein [Crateriforma conspicua]|uniref:DUF4347 domain-containing protein n=1 Tax=Crateriforma conspicua TaxID=2527996 RepID=UPI00118BA69A|nr:DUF4347 domain-containing protein [Crateriforma conspicua]QDV63846.1 hypothetical protein Mal65_29930 [Crateriforma conspicua]
MSFSPLRRFTAKSNSRPTPPSQKKTARKNLSDAILARRDGRCGPLAADYQQPLDWSVSNLEPRLMLAADAGIAVATPEAPAATVVQAPCTDSASREICETLVLVANDVADMDLLLADVDPSAEIQLLDSQASLIDQVTTALSGRRDVRTLHLITHGDVGVLRLGDQRVDADQLRDHADQVRQWNHAFAAGADVLVYGCRSAAGDDGLHLIRTMASLAGCDVSASDDVTGFANDSSISADWVLERQIGTIESELIVTRDVQSRYRYNLADPSESAITVEAAGSTGEEIFELLVDGEVVASWAATTELQSYHFDTSGYVGAIDPSRVQVRFTNDLYLPDQGIDRNLLVDKVIIDGVSIESESSSTFSSGTWLPGDGIVSGYGRGDVLHTDGFFQYAGPPSPEPVIFADSEWRSDGGGVELSVDTLNDDLVILGSQETAVWTEFQVNEYETIEIDLAISRSGDSDERNVTFGVDYFDQDYNEIGEFFITMPSGANETYQLPSSAPEGTTSATFWIWMSDSTTGEVEEVVVDEFRVRRISTSDDTTPPVVSLPAGQTFTYNGRNTPSFVLNFTDDSFAQPGTGSVRVNDNSQLVVTDPNGRPFEQSVTFTGGDLPGEGVFVVREIEPGPDGFVEGVYTVTAGRGYLIDGAGNLSEAADLGTFRLEIQDGPDNPDDVTPPTVELLTTQLSLTDGPPEFVLRSSDTESDIRFVPDNFGVVQLTDGSGQIVPTRGIAGGPGPDPRTLFELLGFRDDYVVLPGIYTVSITGDYVIDGGDNLNVPGTLGTFEVIA